MSISLSLHRLFLLTLCQGPTIQRLTLCLSGLSIARCFLVVGPMRVFTEYQTRIPSFSTR